MKARPGSKDRSAAEGRAIAICTKSVLQTKGRTIRKVRCRDKVLETQPMKPQEAGVADQTGGKLFAMGADTPVFNNEAVADWNGFPVMWMDPRRWQKWLDGRIAKYGAVVRMVSAGDGEIPIHRMLKDMIGGKSPPFDSPFVVMHINLWAGDGIYRVDPVETRSRVDKTLKVGDDMRTKLDRIIGRFERYKWYGLVTRTQQKDVRDLRGRPFINALCAILRVLLHIDGRIVHFDLHTRNMALMQNGIPVMHDVGRMKIRDVLADFAPWEVGRPGAWNKRILRNVLKPIFQWPNYNMDYGQYFYIARFFKDLRKGVHNAGAIKFAKEVFPTPVGPKWEHNDMTPTTKEQTEAWEANEKAFEAWLDESSGLGGDKLPQRHRHINWIRVQNGLRVYDASGNVVNANDTKETFLYLDPPFETRYHQIARVFDILSVLKALSWRIPDTMAYYYARKTAVKIINLLAATPPTATKRKVGDIIRGYLELTGTRNSYGGNTPDAEDAWAKKYMEEVNDARSGKKDSAMSPDEKAAQDARFAAEKAAADAEAAKVKLAAAKKAAADAEAAMVAARAAAADAEAAVVAARAAAAAGAEAIEAIEDGPPPQPGDDLNEAVGSEDIIADLNAVPIPKQMALDEAVADASEILRESEDADNSKVLIEKQGMMSPEEVVKEAAGAAEVLPTENAPPNIKRLKNPIVFEDEEKEEKEEAEALAEPKTDVTYEIGPDGKPIVVRVAQPVPPPPAGGRRTPRRKGLPQLL